MALTLLLIAAVVYERAFFEELSNNNISRRAQRYISSQSAQIDKQIEAIAQKLAAGEDLWTSDVSGNFLVFVSERGQVSYWNSNRISPARIPFSRELTCRQIDNAWFLYKSYRFYHFRVDVLANIKNDYAISNAYFQNDGAGSSELSQYSISEKPQLGFNPVFGVRNEPLFYFSKTELNQHNLHHSFLSSVLYFVLFLASLLFLSAWHRRSHVNLLSVLSFGVLFLTFLHYFDFIAIFSRAELFSKAIYWSENKVGSLGGLFLFALFCLVLSFSLSHYLRHLKSTKLQALGFTLLLVLSFCFITRVYLNILNNSSINLQLYLIRRLSAETFWVFAVLVLLIASWGRLATVFVSSFCRHKRAYFYALTMPTLCLLFLPEDAVSIISSAGFILAFISLLRREKRVAQFLFFDLLLASILLSFAMTVLTERASKEKNDLEKLALLRSLPEALLYERDYTTEEMLHRIWAEMQNDMTLKNIPIMVFNSAEYYTNYLRTNYFSGALKEYEMQVIICNPENYLQIEGTQASPNCYDYFSKRLRRQGEPVEGTGFYWQKNNNGRVSYFCWLKISVGTLMETSVFVELESPILSEGRGYPEMLRKHSNTNSDLAFYHSFARYAGGRLISSSGDFRYPPGDRWMGDFSGETQSIDFDKHTHLCYRIAEGSRVVLTEPKRSFFAPVYAYIYNFLFFYFSFLVIHLFSKKHRFVVQRTVSTDIRMTIFAILFLSLLLVGTASVLYPLNVYKKNQETAISEKGESFLNGISRELSGVAHLHEVSPNALQGLAQSLSNILNNDVHIYDLSGRLYASSRPLLFNYKLQGDIINPQAYRAFKYENLTRQIQDERIGNNLYKSSYYVIVNTAEEPVAYVNVPFFSSREDEQKNFTDFVVLLLNIYLILVILVIIFTFFSVNAITKPLLVIQEGLSKMRLGSNEKITYRREDEIGSLVEKYNVMVDELNASVEQLAKSEREVAWQRMARQIAHEIKNPLTPMKLSIQHLARTKTLSPESFDDYFDKTAHTLIEQIDNLSNIATSFATFAKISDGVPELLELNERLNNVVTLFKQSGSQVDFTPEESPCFIMMDKDHFIQVFNNLIKNALQSIPQGRKGKISLSIKKRQEMVDIFVKDNGSGINENTSDKIFQPNFTTKNSGMGLGLAISKKMINHAEGDISFITKIGEGTTFKVTLPYSLPNPTF